MQESEILRQWEAVDRLNDGFDDLHILKGVECDILENSKLDLSDATLARADWVVASMHFGLHQPRKQLTRRLLRAIEHPEVCVIGHPTGRVVGHYDGCDFDTRAVFEAAKETGTFLELNSNPRRLDLHEKNCRLAKDMGIPIVISSDAHSVAALDVLRFGIDQARRGALAKADVANTLEWEELCRRCKKGTRRA